MVGCQEIIKTNNNIKKYIENQQVYKNLEQVNPLALKEEISVNKSLKHLNFQCLDFWRQFGSI